MLLCSMKCNKMNILEKLPTITNTQTQITEQEYIFETEPSNVQTAVHISIHQMKVSVIDTMAEVQALSKPEWIKNCLQLSDHFSNLVLQKYVDSDEIHLVFDRYDITQSLKMNTRVKRQGGIEPVYFYITDTTQIANVPLKKLLTHT